MAIVHTRLGTFVQINHTWDRIKWTIHIQVPIANIASTSLDDFDEFLLDVSFDDGGFCEGISQESHRGVHGHFPIHGKEAIDGIGQINTP